MATHTAEKYIQLTLSASEERSGAGETVSSTKIGMLEGKNAGKVTIRNAHSIKMIAYRVSGLSYAACCR